MPCYLAGLTPNLLLNFFYVHCSWPRVQDSTRREANTPPPRPFLPFFLELRGSSELIGGEGYLEQFRLMTSLAGGQQSGSWAISSL